MPKFYLPRKFKLYCRKSDAIHVFTPKAKWVVCTECGHVMSAANVVAQYATDGNVVRLPYGAEVDDD